MKLAVSYFSQIRFFKPYMIPISTAVWDPKWYHANKDQKYIFKDKNGVINGVRSAMLMPGETCKDLCRGPGMCFCKTGIVDPNNCDFLKAYTNQLNSIDFNIFMNNLEEMCNKVKNVLNFYEEPIVVFIVHESCDNICSERIPIINVFRNKGYEIDELKYPIKENY